MEIPVKNPKLVCNLAALAATLFLMSFDVDADPILDTSRKALNLL
jgi:hypothetical protein